MQTDSQRIVLQLGSSRLLGIYLAAVHAAALAVLFWCSLYQPIVLVLLLPVGISFVRHWRMHVSRCAARAVTVVEAHENDQWSLIERSGQACKVLLVKENFVASWMTVLTFQQSRLRRRHVVLLCDNSDPDAVRHLRVRLRYTGG